MNIADVLLTVMTVLVCMTAIAILGGEYQPALRQLRSKVRPMTQTGDSSLSLNSVNWLAAIAFSAALYIGFVLM